jgi:AcrR family transcriptional regulator
MPKIQRTPAEIEEARAGILEKAVDMIADLGYENFTMRKLAGKLGITATTIYNYYTNKDDLFIAILIRGFEDLNGRLATARRASGEPAEQLRAMIEAYTDYGLTNANFYNLMYAWHVPKYNHYAGTPMEPAARMQLEAALKVPGIFHDVIRNYAFGMNKTITDDESVFLMIHYWSQIHGFIAGCNNTTLSYIHSDPLALKGRHLDRLAEHFRNDVSHLTGTGEKQ